MSDPVAILAKGTGAGNSESFRVERYKPIIVGVFPDGNIGTDTGVLNMRDPDGNWMPCTDDNGYIALTEDNGSGVPRTTIVVLGAGEYRIEAAARTLSWGVFRQDYY